ncbi:NAD(P)/FAD-dependent oxidoreductase [Halotia branconii]|uniref:NAD(P)/FAD-dependent oxidoreductase n=1 Tax=Halotia branconii CENA392 TaxID=1539056 RepID=A0AAJ6P7Z9_9CYAN|nr:NAD(P)/FAD-dependent oxidoreductase [Halotia branconii]WGV24269.1 NAD(P)/FAD-dependent oxidoreductase [Halotia branconii CENA392]
MIDVAVVGAGMAGLVCAQQLSQAGYSVIVVEKSRGLGGRVATRRLYGTYADHGACYLNPKGELLGRLVELLSDRHLLEVWTDQVYELSADGVLHKPENLIPRYVAPGGMSAIAKFLAQDLEILLNQRVINIYPTLDNSWCLTLESSNEKLIAQAVVFAIPAPQALTLLEPLGASLLSKEFIEHLISVEFDPCITAIAGYQTPEQSLPQWKAINFIDHTVLGWVGLDSSKRPTPQQPIFVVQSSAHFAQLHLESPDLQPVGQEMLQCAAQTLTLPWLAQPDWMQVHRWRYAFPQNPFKAAVLSANTSLPLVCCGDWCGGNLIEGAMLSGMAASVAINNQLHQLTLPNMNFFTILN